MELSEIEKDIHPNLYSKLIKDIKTLRPSQEKSINSGLIDNNNLLVCTPTASGKTLVAEIAMLSHIYNNKGKAIYIVPLKALASEKYEEFKIKYHDIKVGISIGDIDSSDRYLEKCDLIVTVAEKLDSLIRHKAIWLTNISCIVIDEIHLLNDTSRGPTLEILITILRKIVKNAQIIGLSATIGNPDVLAGWLKAKLVIDDWRPVKLRKGIFHDGEIEFYDD
ncbi:DEAD/DEAH box helicase [archaeon]|jgi:helicase|nr:DEAD/DEAH box helicase [archaeon]MBT4351819.1 DEAD/DEAH box helicase [archaeon]MBT4648658.1 DEAD/DEAH box helicase [archaeon]MBT6821836.1 DEAD/DEAH box helicase [archaeon]MBT7392246.1 DEAD/DEAH box helicase [archaeon]